MEMNDLLAFLLWPLALYVWSLSLNLWRAAWGNHLEELTEADVVPLWQLACFPPLSVVWSIDDSGRTKQNRKSLYGLDAVCSPLGMHIRHALHAQRRVKQVRCIRWQCMTNVLESERDFLQFLSNTLFWPTLKHEFIKTAPQGLE